jgi:hypothetical protein
MRPSNRLWQAIGIEQWRRYSFILMFFAVAGFYPADGWGQVNPEDSTDSLSEILIPVSCCEGTGEESRMAPLKVRDNGGEWITAVIEDLGYEVAYPRDWKPGFDVASILSFYKTYGEGKQEKRCRIDIAVLGRDTTDWVKPCAQTLLDRFANKSYDSNPENSFKIANSPALRFVTSKSAEYCFGPNPHSSGEFCFRITLKMKTAGEYDRLNKRWVTLPQEIEIPECRAILDSIIASFKFLVPKSD